MIAQSIDLDRYWQSLDAVLPSFAPDEQHAAVALYRELARGTPVSTPQLAEALSVPEEEAAALLGREALSCLIFPDEEGRILGFGGLAAAPMPHRLELRGRTLWTWCAWDSLFIPEILGESAKVVSNDPRTGAAIHLQVTPEGVDAADPTDTVVSFVRVDGEQFESSANHVMRTFCHFVFFFESPESGTAWAAEHEGTFITTLDEAVDLARRLNARSWSAALPRR